MTNASITPDTSSTTTRPSATPAAARPSSARAAPRVRRIDHRPAQPQAVPGGDEDRGELEQAVRGDEAEEDVQPAHRGHQAAGDADIEGVLQQDPDDRQAEQHSSTRQPAATQALLVHTWKANELAGAEVVRLEVPARLGELTDLRGYGDRRPHLGVTATHAPTTQPTRLNATPTATHQRQVRYTAAGKDTVKKRASSRHAGTGAPLTAERARATSVDSLATRAGSGELDRTTDRCVAVRW